MTSIIYIGLDPDIALLVNELQSQHQQGSRHKNILNITKIKQLLQNHPNEKTEFKYLKYR